MSNQYPSLRMRRLRASPAMRDLVRENHLRVTDLICPFFIEEGLETPAPIASMPGVLRYPETALPELMAEAHDAGIRAVILFGVSRHKDAEGADTCSETGLLARMLERARRNASDMVLMADCCFCEYTDHGHCGILLDGDVDNDLTLAQLARQAVVAARAGADVVAPSGMMDGGVAAIREALDAEGFERTSILAYSTKYASSFYGPFRDAAGTTLDGDRKTYQIDPANMLEGLRESDLDEAEGADMLMVKPGMPYLDMLARIRDRTELPLVVYQVSGEYAMLKFAAQAGALDERAVAMESLLAFKRAGADLILSYFALDAAKWLAE